jgi:ribonuclease HII
MANLAVRYPAYTWERNVGYTTRAHIRGLDASGITPHHRRSFFRVSQLMLDLDAHPVDLVMLDELESIVSSETSPGIAQA